MCARLLESCYQSGQQESQIREGHVVPHSTGSCPNSTKLLQWCSPFPKYIEKRASNTESSQTQLLFTLGDMH